MGGNGGFDSAGGGGGTPGYAGAASVAGAATGDGGVVGVEGDTAPSAGAVGSGEASGTGSTGSGGTTPASGSSPAGAAGVTPASGGSTVASGGTVVGAAGNEFIWSGYDLSGVELDESASGAPVPADDPGNDYGYTMLGNDDPGMMLDCPEGTVGLTANCMAFQVCDTSCSTAAECPTVTTGTASPTCRNTFGANSCELPCGGDLICPDGMACISVQSSGYFCAWPSPIWMPGCPGYCADQDDSCDSSTTGDCCEGLVCAPWEQCEPGSCLRLSWPCTESTAPCCEGLACVDGYCT